MYRQKKTQTGALANTYPLPKLDHKNFPRSPHFPVLLTFHGSRCFVLWQLYEQRSWRRHEVANTRDRGLITGYKHFKNNNMLLTIIQRVVEHYYLGRLLNRIVIASCQRNIGRLRNSNPEGSRLELRMRTVDGKSGRCCTSDRLPSK